LGTVPGKSKWEISDFVSASQIADRKKRGEKNGEKTNGLGSAGVSKTGQNHLRGKIGVGTRGKVES